MSGARTRKATAVKEPAKAAARRGRREAAAAASRTTLDALENRLGYAFQDRALLTRALTHASHGDGRQREANNERLEFLGDRVLGLLAAQTLFARFSAVDEGGLAPRLNALVRQETCARAARRVELGPALRMSRAEDERGGRDKDSILGDACEALIGALYLDGGLDAAHAFFDRVWAEELDGLTDRPKDPKSALQEWAAARKFEAPVYALVERAGPDHRPRFTVAVRLVGLGEGAGTGGAEATGEGGSKQAAERAAAEALLARVVGQSDPEG